MSGSHKTSVLVVDDQKEIRDLFLNTLDPAEFLCETVETGREALTRLMKRSYDVVFLDLILPDLDGETILMLIQRHRPNVHTVIISVQDDEGVINEMMAMGAKAYLVKPFQAEDILDIVRNVEHHQTVYEIPDASWEVPPAT